MYLSFFKFSNRTIYDLVLHDLFLSSGALAELYTACYEKDFVFISKFQNISNDTIINTINQEIVQILGEHSLAEHLGDEILTFKYLAIL